VGRGRELLQVLLRSRVARQHRHARLPHAVLGHDLRAQRGDRRRGRADEGDPGHGTCLGELGVLGEKAITRMDGVGAAGARRAEDPLDVEVALARRWRPDPQRLVRLAHVKRARVRIGEHGNRAPPETPRGAENAAGDLAAVRNQQGSHRRHIRYTPKRAGSSGAWRTAASDSASIRRV